VFSPPIISFAQLKLNVLMVYQKKNGIEIKKELLKCFKVNMLTVATPPSGFTLSPHPFA